MPERRVVIAGGGAAGFFAAITCAEANPSTQVVLLEKGPQFLSKVRISGGGRCNVTHACFDPRELSAFYPRGGAALLGPFHRFQPRDTMAWFEERGVRLKVESDQRVFPVTDSSQTIIDCLMASARRNRVQLLPNSGLVEARRTAEGRFALMLQGGNPVECDALMLATGGCRGASTGAIATSLGHTLEPPVPSLFTLEIRAGWLNALSGITLDSVELSVPGTALREKGALLITHAGLSGPAVLRLSAWGARVLHGLNYQFALRANWAPQLGPEPAAEWIQSRRAEQASRFVVNTPVPTLPTRLWEGLVIQAGIPRETRWAALSRSAQHQLLLQLGSTELQVSGKSLNRDEFVTCGGVPLREVNFKTMESRICPGLFFGGELLDIDGVTGGFNFQAAWTTGWIAGTAMARPEKTVPRKDTEV
jgi:predicted Rossmann fold flavoprotein